MTNVSSPTPTADAKDRLLKAWRGEILAGKSYELIAGRLAPREADILRQMAAAEASHRGRIEARMAELGIPIPDPATVRLSAWARLQSRVAPVDRLLAAREAAEDDEVDDLYKRATGDGQTDALLRELRKEERSHSRAVNEIRSSGRSEDAADPNAQLSPVQRAAKERLDKITNREKWHSSGGGWVSGVIYGANDGLASVFGLVAGVSGATGGSSIVLTAGVAGAAAAALSMATGAWLASRSEQEIAHANVEHERREIAEHPEEEREELSLFFQLKGVEPDLADQMAAQIAENPDAMLQALSQEEFGGMGEVDDAAGAAVAAGLSTGIGAMLPVLPFLFMTGTVAIIIAAIVSLLGHFAVGAAKSLVTLRSWWSAGLEMTLAGVIVGGATFLIGLALPS
ncbi:VIT1/CCC1 transporter family protein [Conexibacter sp. DBS9H8]|uniref:VIT1/CCC1 transporter family protein n=1 Tax=Conexibacter sp. DBS9H8 TaxID=2937801 RepID=UPI00200DA5BC|nr:VIT1/CCC1 transporter family protein [Conexibacter sp. DBS9H8]